jgi:hypothetical protein
MTFIHLLGALNRSIRMTTTRKYYETLIDCFSKLNSTDKFHPKEYLEIKSEISNLINRIEKFDLFPLTFSTSFYNLLVIDSIENFEEQKLNIVNEIHYELIECLWTTRLRFGGELIQYISRIKIALLELTIEEINHFEKIKKEPIHYTFPEKFEFTTSEEKNKKIAELVITISKAPKKDKVAIKKQNYIEIENELTRCIGEYRSYIFDHYPSLAESFTFYNKKIFAYITQAMSKELFEFRIHSYSSTDGDNSVKLRYEYYDFYPSYFHNLEEITDKFSGAHVTTLKREDYSFSNPFSIENIHHELIELFIQNSSENDIQKFSEFFLKCEGYKIGDSELKRVYRFDIYGKKDEKDFLFEIFHLQQRSIIEIERRIDYLKKMPKEISTTFIFTSFPGDKIFKILKEKDIKTIFIKDLTRKHFALDNSLIPHWYIKSKLSSIKIKSNSTEIKFTGDTLISRLEKCPAGEKNWSDYETIGVDIFCFLFKDNFKVYLSEEQVENDLKNHRRDLLVNNNHSDSTSFWADVKKQYNCSAIIVDFKNYSQKLNSTTLFSVSKYTKKNVGDFAIVFSRKGIDSTAKTEQKELYNNGKLLIDFSDIELIEMIREKIIGKDPIDRLDSKKFELIKKY